MTLTAFELKRALATGVDPAEWARRAEKLRARYTIEVCDRDLRSLGQLEAWDGLQMVHRMCEVGTGTVKAAATAHNRELLGDYRGLTIVAYQNGKARQAGRLRLAGEDQDQTSVMTMAWDNPLQLLADRPALPNPGTETGDGPASHDVRGGWTTSAVLGYVDANVGGGAWPGHRAAGLVMGEDPQAGVWLGAPIAAKDENLLELVRGFAIPNGVVFDVVTRGQQHVFHVRQIRDLRQSVQFSRQLHNLGPNSRRLTKPGAVAVLVLGPEFGGRQMRFRVQTDDSRAQEAAWGGGAQITKASTSVVKADESVYAAETAAAAAANELSEASDDYGKYTAQQADQAEERLARVLEDEDSTAAEKAEAQTFAAVRRAEANAAAAQHVERVAATAAAEAVLAAAVEKADREQTFHSLYAEAERDLDEQGETAEFTATIVEGIYQLDTGDGGDFGIGDVVRCYFDGYPEPIDRSVREGTETVSVADGRRLVVVIGDPGATTATGAAVRTKDVIRALSRLQVRS